MELMREKTDPKRFPKYWERSVPWTFKHEKTDYETKRRMRYSLHDYMPSAIGFNSYRSKLVLEIGSGGGIDSAEFGRTGATIFSLDFTDLGSRSTHSLLTEAGVPSRVVRGSAYALPYADNMFDCVYSFGVLHHIPDIETVLAEISRVLNDRGQLTCMVYNRNSLLYAYSIMLLHKDEGKDEEELIRAYSERVLDCPYTRAYTKEEAVALFSKYFRKVTANVYYNVIDLPNKRKVKFSMTEDCELGWHILVKAGEKL